MDTIDEGVDSLDDSFGSEILDTVDFDNTVLVLFVVFFTAAPGCITLEPFAFSLFRITLLAVGELELDDALGDDVEGDCEDDVAIIDACS